MQRGVGLRPDSPAQVFNAGRNGRRPVPGPIVRRGVPPPVPQRRSGSRTAAALRAGGHPIHPVRQLLPRRVGHHRLRPTQQYPLRREGQRRRQRRAILPGNHRRRPFAVPVGVRTLPQHGTQGDARHRPGLSGRPPGRGVALRNRPLRQRPGGPDHHIRHSGRQGGPARRGARLGNGVRRRRPHRPDGALQGPHPGRRPAAESRISAHVPG